MAITKMHVSYVDSTITVKIPTADAPTTGLPFSISLSTTPAVAMDLTSVTDLTSEGLDNIYTITVNPAQSYMVRAGAINSGTYVPVTMAMMQGESYELQPAPFTNNGVLIFKNLDIEAPEFQTITKLSSPGSTINGATVETLNGPPDTDTKTHFVVKFNEAVSGVDNQSFFVSKPGNSYVPVVTVQPLALTGANVLSVSAGQSLPAASLYLVTVNDDTNTVSVSLKTAPPPILIVQELDALLPMVTYGGTSVGTQPMQTQNVSWLKVSLDENTNANQFLLEAGGVPVGTTGGVSVTVPRLEYTFAGNEGMPNFIRTLHPSYAVGGNPNGENSNVIYLGFDSVNQRPTEAPISIAFKTTNNMIVDRAGNVFGFSASSETPEYLDAAGERAFSPIWEGNTTTITDASVEGYARGALVAIDPFTGAKTYPSGFNASLPHFFTDGKPSKDDMGTPMYDARGERVGMDTIDLSGITGGPMVINADLGQAFVYSGNKALVLDVSDYDRYILNDRASDSVEFGNAFYGSEDSEYVVVGRGGDNYLVAGNLLEPTDISSDIKVKNYTFDATGIVRETDIVDYSQHNLGITVHLGDDASKEVFVLYEDDTDSDIIEGFEGVVGSGGDDVISGSNVGNVLVGGAGDDELRGYTDTAGAGDKLYNQAYLNNVYKGPTGTGDFQAAQFLVDSSDILYGGAGDDDLYGGAGRDLLIDLGKAVMRGSDKTGSSGNGTGMGSGLRDSENKLIAEKDVFLVRGDGEDKATIHNFHLSENGVGLAGRSKSANDALIFSIDMTKLSGASLPGLTSMSDEALYTYVYSRLSFEQETLGSTGSIELVVNFKNEDSSQEIKVGSTIITEAVTMLDGGKNRIEVVELKWLAKDGTLDLFNPKMEMDLTNFDQTDEFGNDINIAIALELQQAGTVRGTNNYGVMAAKLSDNDLTQRVYNPGNKDDRILGTTSADSYEYIVQQFTPTVVTPPGQQPPTTPAVITDQVGKDKIFDTGGDDVLMFESASLQDLVFSAVKVGRESKANSLKVVHKQKEALDDGDVKNEGEVVWQGHYKEGGRQAAEVLKIKGGEFEIAQAVYEYNAKGYAKGGPKITADNASDVIMVGQGNGDKFVFDFDAVASVDKTQTARIAGFGLNDKIDISKFGLLEDSVVTHNVNAGMDSTVKLEFDTGFVLNLSFQGAVTNTDLNFALGSVLLT